MARSLGGIYAITNAANGKRYVGQAVNIRVRWNHHRSELERGMHNNQHLQRAWTKRGSVAFFFDVLEEVPAPEMLDAREQHWMDSLRPEYNIAPQSGSLRRWRASPETVARRVAALTGQRRTPEQCARISEAKKSGFAERRALGIFQVSPMKGRTHTEESKRRNAESKRGKSNGPCSPETAAKISAAHRGRPCPEHRRRLISATLSGGTTGRGQLTPEQVREIRALRAQQGIGRIAIAKLMGVSPSAAASVIGNHAYGWVV